MRGKIIRQFYLLRSSPFALLLPLFFCVLCAGNATAQEATDSARLAIEAFIRASGGQENWAAVNNCYVKREAFIGIPDSTTLEKRGTESVFTSSNGYFLWLLQPVSGPIPHTIMGGGSQGFWFTEGDSLIDVLPGMADVNKSNSYCHRALELSDHLSQGLPIVWWGKDTLRNSSVYRLSVHLSAATVDYYFDASSYLLVAVKDEKHGWEVNYKDYQEIAGPPGPLLFPMAKVHFQKDRPATSSKTIAVHCNASLPEGWFEPGLHTRHLRLLRLLDRTLGISVGKAGTDLPIDKRKQ